MSDHFLFQKSLAASVRDTGLTPGQPKILDYLINHDGAIQREIAVSCHIEPASLTAILNGMENKSCIERRTDGGIVFGYFTTFCNYMVSYLPTPHNLAIRIVMVLASTVFVAFGIFLYLPADLIPLAGEGCMQAVISEWRIRQKLSGNCFRRKWVCDIKNGRLLPPVMCFSIKQPAKPAI